MDVHVVVLVHGAVHYACRRTFVVVHVIICRDYLGGDYKFVANND